MTEAQVQQFIQAQRKWFEFWPRSQPQAFTHIDDDEHIIFIVLLLFDIIVFMPYGKSYCSHKNKIRNSEHNEK